MPTTAKPSLDKINNVQALRGFAALLVVFGHTEFALPGMRPFGTFGVDIFFCISGFIMAMIVDRNPEKFLLRRLIRILPLYWTATLGVWLLAVVKPQWMMHTTPNWRDLLLSLLFIPFYKGGGVDPRPVLFVGWTLNFEMYFYVVLAVCLRLTRRHATAYAALAVFLLMLACRFSGLQSAWARVYGDLLVLEFALGIGGGHARGGQRGDWRDRTIADHAADFFYQVVFDGDVFGGAPSGGSYQEGARGAVHDSEFQ